MERRRVLKRALLWAAALLAGSLVGIAVLIDREASAPDLKPRIEKATADFLGRPVAIGALEWRRWPDAMLVAKGFQVYDDPLKARVLVDAPVVEAHVALLSLFKLAAGVTELRFVSPRVALRREKDGVWNVERLAEEIAARPDEPRRRWGTLAFNWFAISGGTVTVEDASGGLSALAPLAVSGRGKLRFGRKHVHFPFDLAVSPEGSAASLAVSGSLGGRTRLRVVLKKGDPSMARLLWPPAARWSGRWDGELDYDERALSPWTLKARAEPLVVSTAAPRIDLLELTGAFASSESSSFTAVVRSSSTEFEARGTVRESAVDLDVKSRAIDLDALLPLLRAAAAEPPAKAARSAKGTAATRAQPPTRLKAAISIDELRYGPAVLRAVRAEVRHSTGPYRFENVSFQSLGGSLSGSGSYSPGGGDGALQFGWTASAVGLQDLFRLAGSSAAAAGTLNSSGSLSTGLGDRFLPGMSGSVSLDLKDGWFGGLPGLLKVFARLNLATLFAAAEGHHRSRVPFDEAHAAVKVSKGRITSDQPLVLKNKTLELAFLGSYDLPSRTVDGKLVVNILTVTDEIIKLIPGVRDILLGGEKSMIPIWVKVTGKADDPDIDVLQARTIAAPFWNTISHVLKLPKTLFKKLKL